MDAGKKLNRNDAIERFRKFAPKPEDQPRSELEEKLRAKGIVDVKLPIDPDAFQNLSDMYGEIIDEDIRWLNWTAYNFNKDIEPEDGHVSKSLKHNQAGMQISDPKNLFHFNNDLIEWWRDQGEYQSFRAPSPFQEFMREGIDLHGQLVTSARNLIEVMDESYNGMSEFYFPGELSAVTFRLLRYDGYELYNDKGRLIVEENSQVAKPHYDRGGMTIQAYASAPGFWYQEDHNRGPGKEKIFPDHGRGNSQMFFGTEHRVLYSSRDVIKALYHGVDRVIDTSKERMPVRTAAIAFVDSPVYDMEITSRDTQPDRADKGNLRV